MIFGFSILQFIFYNAFWQNPFPNQLQTLKIQQYKMKNHKKEAAKHANIISCLALFFWVKN